MSPEVLNRAVEPFFSTKEVGQGTGLGLSMVYGFAKQSGGHLVLNSVEGEGTAIELYVPCSKTPPCRGPSGRSSRNCPRAMASAFSCARTMPTFADFQARR